MLKMARLKTRINFNLIKSSCNNNNVTKFILVTLIQFFDLINHATQD